MAFLKRNILRFSLVSIAFVADAVVLMLFLLLCMRLHACACSTAVRDLNMHSPKCLIGLLIRPLGWQVWQFANRGLFVNTVTAVILLNIILMATESFQQPQWWTDTMDTINWVFIAVYIVEIVVTQASLKHSVTALSHAPEGLSILRTSCCADMNAWPRSNSWPTYTSISWTRGIYLTSRSSCLPSSSQVSSAPPVDSERARRWRC